MASQVEVDFPAAVAAGAGGKTSTQDIRRRHLVAERDWPSLDNYPIARASISVIVR